MYSKRTVTLPRLLAPLCVLIVALIHDTASAQDAAFYGTADITTYGYNTGYANDISFRTTRGGGILGGFYNFPIASRLAAGIDTRFGYSPTATGGTFGAAALRIAFVPHKVRLSPYFQFGGGYIHVSGSTGTTVFNGLSSVTTSSQGRNGGGAELAFGLDVRLTDHFTGTAYLGSGLVYRIKPHQR